MHFLPYTSEGKGELERKNQNKSIYKETFEVQGRRQNYSLPKSQNNHVAHQTLSSAQYSTCKWIFWGVCLQYLHFQG